MCRETLRFPASGVCCKVRVFYFAELAANEKSLFNTFLGAWWCVCTTGTRSRFRMKTTTRSSTARSRQILEMTCLHFSLIKLKCENHTQMSVRQFGFWPCALLSGFCGIFYVFKGSSCFFLVFFFFSSFPSCFFLAKFQHVRSKIYLFIWAHGLLTSRSNQTDSVCWTWMCQVTQSLT